MGEMRDSREFGTDELPSKDQEIDRLRAENERLTASRDGYATQCADRAREVDRWKARALAAEARAEKAVEDMAQFMQRLGPRWFLEQNWFPASQQENFPKPQRKDGGEPCGECRLKPGETCDICGAKAQ